jgi:thiol-disulfide isomerase/thioredoxin
MCTSAHPQSPSRIKIGDLMQRLEQYDTLYVVNFWATWCPPCVAELPEFNRADTAWGGKPVKILLVSLDFPEAWPAKLSEFLKKKQIRSEVLWLDETDANTFIPQVSVHWSGSIPATLISCKATHTREFKESKIDFTYLDEQIRKSLLH